MDNAINQSIRGYLKIFFRRKWTVIVPAFSGLVLGICLSIILPREYNSNTTILVEEGKTDNPLFDGVAVSSTMTQRAQVIRETILGWDSLVELIKRLKMDRNVKTSSDFEELVKVLRKDIGINLRNNNIISLSYSSSDPQQAQAVVQNVTDIFIGRNVSVQNRETADAIKFIEEQLHVYRGKIKSAEIAQIKDQLNELLVDSTELHPLVKSLREQINKKMDELKKQNLDYSEDAKLDENTMNPMVSQIKQALDTMNGAPKAAATAAASSGDGKDIYKVMLIDKLDNVMARDVNVNEAIYNSLLQRLETAKITQRLQSSKEGTKYTILNPPRVPTHAVKPNIFLVIFLGLFLGLGAGIGMVFASELMDKSFLDVQEASSFLGTPLLGVISRINTQEAIEYSHQQNVWRLFWMASIGVLLIAFTIMIRALIRP